MDVMLCPPGSGEWLNHGGSRPHHDPALAQRLISHGPTQDPSISVGGSTLALPCICKGALMPQSAPINRPCCNSTPVAAIHKPEPRALAGWPIREGWTVVRGASKNLDNTTIAISKRWRGKVGQAQAIHALAIT